MKKIMNLIVSFTLIVSLTACGDKPLTVELPSSTPHSNAQSQPSKSKNQVTELAKKVEIIAVKNG